MPEHVLAQFDFLGKQIWEFEWSGVLFYKTEGKFGTPSFKCILEDILLMDIGDAVSTGYEFNGDVVQHLNEHPHLRKCIMGHVHSHNNMDVFFSGVDDNELETNAPNHNIYLSTISNNRGEFIAKIGFMVARVDSFQTTYSLLDEGGNEITFTQTQTSLPVKEFRSYECQITLPEPKVDSKMVERCRSMLAAKTSVRGNNTHRPSFSDDLFSEEFQREKVISAGGSVISLEQFLYFLLSGNMAGQGDLFDFLNELARKEYEKRLTFEIQQRIVNNTRRYYSHFYKNDPKFLAYDATLAECIQLLDNPNDDRWIVRKIITWFSDLLEPVDNE